jgi:class 3 adenylate cyclase/tetratricopeptide (TPR) repeat protein
MFVDLVGFTTYSEGRDPEEVRLTLSDYFARAEETIELYGGVVEKFIGDAVMAVWGTPVAREDDTERAVRASLELLQSITALGHSIGAPLQGRAGVFTGEAAVNLEARGQGMVAGDMVNTAARLQSVADPGTVLVDRSTYQGARQAINFEPSGSLRLKGKEELVETWRPTSVFAGAGGYGAENAIEPAFTGRDEQLRMIKDLLHSTDREGKPRLASLVGIGGIGKSRIVWEFFKYIDGLSDVIYWHVGRSPSYGEGVAFWALAEMVRMRTGIAETDDDAGAVEKLGVWLAENFPDEAERAWLGPHIEQLIGLSDAKEPQREQLFAAWRLFFERIAEQGTVVLVFEDLHWADPGLIDFIEHLMVWARSSPILVLTLARPELFDRRSNWGVGQRNFHSMYLEPLADDEMTLLLKSVASELPPAVGSEIIERAEGVPLYAVEMVRMLIDRGDLVQQGSGFAWIGRDEHVDVPDSLHSLIASRLDALDTKARLLIQDASVLGKTFTTAALAAVSSLPSEEVERHLEELARREVVSVDADPRSPERGQYGFVQSLIREVAYQTLSNADRSERHRAAAGFFESMHESDMLDVVATHYFEAFKNSRQDTKAAPLADKARSALVGAAERARALGSPTQALALLEKALGITDEGRERADLLVKAGSNAGSAGLLEAAIEFFRASTELLANEDDHEVLANAQVQLGATLFYASRLDEAEELLTQAVGDLQDPTTLAAARLYSELARAYVFKGDSAKGEEYSMLAMPAAERAGDMPLIVNTLITRGVNSLMGGRTNESDVILVGSLRLAEKHGLIGEQVRAYINISANQLSINPSQALDVANRGLDLARRFGLRDQMVVLSGNALSAMAFLARWDDARALYEELVDLKSDELQHVIYNAACELHAFTGDLAELKRTYSVSHEFLRDSTSRQDQVTLAYNKALSCFLEGDYAGVSDATSDPAVSEFVTMNDAMDVSGHVALWERDVARAHAVLNRLDSTPVMNQWFSARKLTLGTGLRVLEGETEDAASLFQEVLRVWDELDIPVARAFCQMTFALLVDGPEADAAGLEAEAFFLDAGNDILVSRFREARSS